MSGEALPSGSAVGFTTSSDDANIAKLERCHRSDEPFQLWSSLIPTSVFRPPNGWRVSGERRSEA